MVSRCVIAAILVAPALMIACGSDRLTGPEPGAAVVQGTGGPTPSGPAGPVVPFPFTPDVEDVIPSGVYTMTIEFDRSCGKSSDVHAATVTAKAAYLRRDTAIFAMAMSASLFGP